MYKEGNFNGKSHEAWAEESPSHHPTEYSEETARLGERRLLCIAQAATTHDIYENVIQHGESLP